MSLILDALNRSRQDQSEVPGLDSDHLSPEQPRSNRSQWLLGGALVLALVVIGYLLLVRGGEQEQIPEVVDTSPAGDRSRSPLPQQANPETSLPGSETKVPVGASAHRDASPPQEPIPDPVEKLPESEAKVPVTAGSDRDAPQALGDPAVAALYQKDDAPVEAPATEAQKSAEAEPAPEQEPPAPAAQQEQPVDIEQMLREAQGELENARLQEHPAPFISELSQQKKNDIPTIFYERHDYSGKPGQSSVVLNGRTVREGAQAGAGLRVEEILPDSVVLDHKGIQFRLRALNSWVNL